MAALTTYKVVFVDCGLLTMSWLKRKSSRYNDNHTRSGVKTIVYTRSRLILSSEFRAEEGGG